MIRFAKSYDLASSCLIPLRECARESFSHRFFFHPREYLDTSDTVMSDASMSDVGMSVMNDTALSKINELCSHVKTFLGFNETISI